MTAPERLVSSKKHTPSAHHVERDSVLRFRPTKFFPVMIESRTAASVVFTYSLRQERLPVPAPHHILPGYIFMQGGFPGHAVLVVDVATNQNGGRIFLLVQNFMPAQDLHLVVNPQAEQSPWYRAAAEGSLATPAWRFHVRDFRRQRIL